MQITCEVCQKVFQWEKPNKRGGCQIPKICKDPACYKARQTKLYAAWSKNNPEKVKANYEKQYKKRKKAKELQEYGSKDVPETQQWECRRCGEMSHNRINCPACLAILSNRFSGEYADFIYNQSNEDRTSPLPG